MTDTPENEPEERLPVPRPPAEVAPVERFTSPPSVRAVELTPERAAQVDDRLLRLDRPAIVVLERVQVGEEVRAQVLVDERLARRVSFARAAPTDPLGQDGCQQPPAGTAQANPR